MNFKKLLVAKMPVVSRDTPYWRALGICSLMFLLAEVVMSLGLLFRQIKVNEFLQISAGLLVLLPLSPLFLRMKNGKGFGIIMGVSVMAIVVLLLSAVSICDQYYVNKVFESYLKGEDYQSKATPLSAIASPNAIAYTKFFMGERDFLVEKVREAKRLMDKAEHDQSWTEEVLEFRECVTARMLELEGRFHATGYCNKKTSSYVRDVHAQYERLLKVILGIEAL